MMRIYLDERFADCVPLICSYKLMIEQADERGAYRSQAEACFEEIGERLYSAMQEDCKCGESSEHTGVLITLETADGKCNCQITSTCEDCIKGLTQQVQVVSLEEFEGMCMQKERSFMQ